MSPVVLRWRWSFYAKRLGCDHPRVRALFGRYVGARVGRAITPAAGRPAWVGFNRQILQPGYQNRSYRRHFP